MDLGSMPSTGRGAIDTLAHSDPTGCGPTRDCKVDASADVPIQPDAQTCHDAVAEGNNCARRATMPTTKKRRARKSHNTTLSLALPVTHTHTRAHTSLRQTTPARTNALVFTVSCAATARFSLSALSASLTLPFVRRFLCKLILALLWCTIFTIELR